MDEGPDLLQRVINGLVGAFIGAGVGMFLFLLSDGRQSGFFVPAIFIGGAIGALSGDRGILGMLGFIGLFIRRRRF